MLAIGIIGGMPKLSAGYETSGECATSGAIETEGAASGALAGISCRAHAKSPPPFRAGDFFEMRLSTQVRGGNLDEHPGVLGHQQATTAG
jgi:hypothetical protein